MSDYTTHGGTEMSTEDTEAITKLRLAEWAKALSTDHATPMLLVGIGHDHNSGKISLCVPEGIDDAVIVNTLKYALIHFTKKSR